MQLVIKNGDDFFFEVISQKIFFSYLAKTNYLQMPRIIFLSLLFFCSLAGFGQNNATPPSVQPPADSSRLILHVFAKGVQIYVGAADPKDPSHYVWTFTGPRADLYADSAYHQLIGQHYAGADKNPVWADNDGSMVTGVKLHQANSPSNLAIPWLLLKAVATRGDGVLTPVAFIQRVRTTGGKAPAVANAADNSHTLEVAYTAEYLFYGAK
jgi:hypothetical protein